ncbi:minor tail protein [Gordonia phage Mollymur]|uniref:Minor tail protein n=1 Tax=Gordonia phage Mollymur TaxID=2590895 RepID=A0A4Y6E9P8_9CAUD|nr:minor tail protein [Gordonia phage Mollymur]QDF15401.1 minor tail protein [Gordonia phage Mollymur]
MPDTTFMHVTGQWGHIIDDTTFDGDPDPDEVLPSGSVRFTPMIDWLPAGAPTRSISVGSVLATVEHGELLDLQGRNGVRLVATIGGRRVRWKADVSIQWNGVALSTWTVTFVAPADGSGTLRLNDVADAPSNDHASRQPTPVADLNLPTLGDYAYTYRLTGGSFASGAELYYAIGEAPAPDVRWDFELDGGVASIVVPGLDIADISTGETYWLMYRASTGAPTTELLTGKVRKQ